MTWPATGNWTGREDMDLMVEIPLVLVAVLRRWWSSAKPNRVEDEWTRPRALFHRISSFPTLDLRSSRISRCRTLLFADFCMVNSWSLCIPKGRVGTLGNRAGVSLLVNWACEAWLLVAKYYFLLSRPLRHSSCKKGSIFPVVSGKSYRWVLIWGQESWIL